MVQRVHIVLEDDLDGSPAEETVTFGLDGKTYEIDLNEGHARDLRDALALYVGHARAVGRSNARSNGSAPRGDSDAAAIRDWAKDSGFEVSERGRIPREVREAYAAAH